MPQDCSDRIPSLPVKFALRAEGRGTVDPMQCVRELEGCATAARGEETRVNDGDGCTTRRPPPACRNAMDTDACLASALAALHKSLGPEVPSDTLSIQNVASASRAGAPSGMHPNGTRLHLGSDSHASPHDASFFSAHNLQGNVLSVCLLGCVRSA